MSESRYASTAQVADALGVGVTTVKRWVDDGILPAVKTVGGHRKMLLADVVRLLRETDLPHADLSKLFAEAPPVDLDDLESLRERLTASLLEGDGDAVQSVVVSAYRHGHGVDRLADELIGPAMAAIGTAWQAGRIDVMREHRATQALVAVLHDLRTLLHRPAGKTRPIAVGGAATGDPTIVPTLLASLALEDDGWQAINLGPDTPASAFVAAMDEFKPELMWICLTHAESAEGLRSAYAKLHRESSRRGISVVIGGAGVTPRLRAAFPSATVGDGLRDLLAVGRTLHAPPKAPKRGRPRST